MMARRFVVALLFLLVAGVSLAVYALRVDRIVVRGIRALPAHTIVDASGLEPGQRILWVRMSAAERRIEKIPGVADAVAERMLPGTVVIHITERVPLARLDGAPQLFVDADGVMFPATDERVNLVLHAWKGRARPGMRVDARSRDFLAALPTFPEILRTAGRRVTMKPSLVLTVVGGIEIRFGPPIDLDSKARVAAAVLASERGRRLEYIDVRSTRVPVSREKGVPTPGPSGEPSESPQVPAPTPAPTPTH
jgi:cell division protein FtsQ